MHVWGVPIHSTQLETEHMLEVGLHTMVPWEVHMVVEHHLVTHLWMLEKRYLIKKYKWFFQFYLFVV
jgi:hypothetical protein